MSFRRGIRVSHSGVSSGMWRCAVGQVVPDVSEYRSALIFMVKESKFFTNVHARTHKHKGRKLWGFGEVFIKLI